MNEWHALENKNKIRYRDIGMIDGKNAIEVKIMQTGAQYILIHNGDDWGMGTVDISVKTWRLQSGGFQYWSWVADKLLELEAIPEGLF